MNKLTLSLIIVGILLVLFGIIFFVNNRYNNSTKFISCWNGNVTGDRCNTNKNIPKQDYRYSMRSSMRPLMKKKYKTYRSYDIDKLKSSNVPIQIGNNIPTLSYKINRLMTTAEEESGAIVTHEEAIVLNINLFNTEMQNTIKFNVILDTGSFDLIVQSDKSLQDSITNKQSNDDIQNIKSNGIWITGFNCLIPNSTDIIKFGSGDVTIDVYNSYFVDDKNQAIGLNIILAQAGMFVASSEFKYRPYEYIFTRILNNDNIDLYIKNLIIPTLNVKRYLSDFIRDDDIIINI